MPSTTINWSQITHVYRGTTGAAFDRVNRPGGTRMWERVYVNSSYQQYYSQGYWVDPDPYWQWVYPPVYNGWWDTSGGGQAAQVWGVEWAWGILHPYFGQWNGNYSGWWVIGGWYGFPDLWQWYWNTAEPYQQYVDPPPYWVDTSYYVTVDNSYWAYYY